MNTEAIYEILVSVSKHAQDLYSTNQQLELQKSGLKRELVEHGIDVPKWCE